jgi:hypothetical protein
MAGAQQFAQVERVNADTQSALAALRATSDALLHTQRDQFGRVLSAALERAVPAAVKESLVESSLGEGIDEDDRTKQLQESIIARVEEALRNRASGSETDPSARVVPRPTERYKRLVSYPTNEEGAPYLTVLKGLTPWETKALISVGTGARQRARIGLPTGWWVSKDTQRGPGNLGLTAKGLLIEELRSDVTHPSEKFVWLDLSEKGVEVMRLLSDVRPIPQWLLDAVG